MVPLLSPIRPETEDRTGSSSSVVRHSSGRMPFLELSARILEFARRRKRRRPGARAIRFDEVLHSSHQLQFKAGQRGLVFPARMHTASQFQSVYPGEWTAKKDRVKKKAEHSL